MSISEGLYVPTNFGKRGHIWHRYVLGEIKGVIRYSRGGGRHYMCKVSTFEKWVKQYEAQRNAPTSSEGTS